VTEPERRDAWPGGRAAALSITFDDARDSQVDVGLPILEEYGLKGTCFVLSGPVRTRLSAWRVAVAAGHEIGNHSRTHPCSGNFGFSRHNALEDYSLQEIESDILSANDAIEQLLDVSPSSFAYPCGQRTVGRGPNARSYVPVIARHFLVGRGWRDEVANDPDRCDLAQIAAVEADGARTETLRRLVDQALADGAWLVLAAHDVGPPGHQTVDARSLRALCAYAHERADVLWTETVSTIGAYVGDFWASQGCRR
jgi:peptidoglycan/xylan/chitin deacetylase (PgdA/CDA1 family)